MKCCLSEPESLNLTIAGDMSKVDPSWPPRCALSEEQMEQCCALEGGIAHLLQLGERFPILGFFKLIFFKIFLAIFGAVGGQFPH